MLTKRHIFTSLLVAVLSVGTAVPSFAKPPQKAQSSAQHKAQKPHKFNVRIAPRIQERSSNIVLNVQNSVSPAEAKSIARSRVKGGQVVDISRRGDTYRVRVIAKNGKVVDVYIDANTGRVKR